MTLSAMIGLLGVGLAGCTSAPQIHSMAPGPRTEHGFPGVSVSEDSAQWPPENLPYRESGHRVYTETVPQESLTLRPLPTPQPSSPGKSASTARTALQKTVYFSFNSARLSYWDKLVLDSLALELKGTKVRAIALYGSTDPLGSEVYNKKLGLWRSQSVKRYLVSRGLSAALLKTLSWGDRKARLFSACRRKSTLCHSQSRSVRIAINRVAG